MPVFVEDPSQLSKARLKSDLIAHNVALPPAKSKKGVYVELHTRHVDQKNGDFSSDEEPDLDPDEEEQDTEALDPSHLTDDGLKAALLQHGIKAGPIVASTRAVYERKLRNLLLSNGHSKSNGKANDADEALLYSDSEKEEEEEDDEAGSGEELEKEEIEESLKQTKEDDLSPQDSKQPEDRGHPRCFLLSSRLHCCASKNKKPSSKRNLRNVLKSSQQTGSCGTRIPSGISRASSVDHPSGLAKGLSLEQRSASPDDSLMSSNTFSITEMVDQFETRKSCSPPVVQSPEFNRSIAQGHWSRSNGPVIGIQVEKKCQTPSLQFYTPKAEANEWRRKETNQEPALEIYKELIADKKTTPSGIYATCRRPIKGAAGRPVQHIYPDVPVSPTTLQRQEVERRLVPLKIQILVFLIVAVLLYVIYVCVEDYAPNPLMALLDNLNQGLDSDETDTQEVEELLELE